jgi:hypothetical protein
MKYTVKEINTTSVKVEYENGSWAVIPIEKGQTKDTISQNCVSFNHEPNAWDKTADVPLTVGETVDYDTTVEDADVDYRKARQEHYPRVEKQMDAAYWARQGDDTQQKEVDTAIQLVKDTIPKTWTGKQSEIATLMD